MTVGCEDAAFMNVMKGWETGNMLKDKIVTFVFLFLIGGLFIANLIYPDQALSFSERRRLAQLPKFSLQAIFTPEYTKDLDTYTLDQFVWREQFRSIKTAFDSSILQKLDTNGLFRVEEDIFSIEYPLREDKVIQMCQKLNTLYDRYLNGMRVYYTVIPDKNYFLPDDGQYLLMDYGKMAGIMDENLKAEMQYINLFDTLTLKDYYNTDGHWRQECLKPVIDKLGLAMGFSAFELDSYTKREFRPFFGAYYGQLASNSTTPDTLEWLENNSTRDAVVTSLGHPNREDLTVYNEEGLGGMDSYDVYLYGAQPLITITNPHAAEGRELILFRDSYGSSLAPLLLQKYAKITLVDLRYITQELIKEYVTFQDQDVLCMFSATIINNSDIIR